jgi:predicted nucleic acid-binding protein
MAKSVSAIIDTNIFFSSIFFPDGNERMLFELADEGSIQIIIMDYVFDEIQEILRRKGINPGLAIDLLDTYRNILHMDMDPEVYYEHLEEATKIVRDKKDWPIYIFAKTEMKRKKNIYLVSGDKDMNTPQVKKALGNRVLTSKELIKLVKV